MKRRRENRDKALSVNEGYFLRTRDVHPLVEEWRRMDREAYDLYLMYRDFLLESDEVDLNDLEVHEVVVSFVLENTVHLRNVRDGLNPMDMTSDQLRALDIVRKFRESSLKLVRESKRAKGEMTALSSLSSLLAERDAKVREIVVREVDFKAEARAIKAEYYEVEE